MTPEDQIDPTTIQQDDFEAERAPVTTHIKLSEAEDKRIVARLDQNYGSSINDHEERLARCREQTKQWREKAGLPGGEEGKSNFRVPITLALCFAKHAREVDALFGPNAGVGAQERGPSDRVTAQRVSIFMKWAVFEQMRALQPIALWALRRLQHGRSFAYVPWRKKTYSKYAKGKSERVVYAEGPEIIPLDNDEIMLPANLQGGASVQTTEWVFRIYDTTPAQMLVDAAENDSYDQDILDENWEKIVRYARQQPTRDDQKDGSKIESEKAEGVERESSSGIVETLRVHECYLRWRMPAEEDRSNRHRLAFNSETGEYEDEGETDTDERTLRDRGGNDFDTARVRDPNTFRDLDNVMREKVQTDLIIRYIPGMKLIVGVQRGDEIYADTPIKRPIMEMALLNDGQYWCMGLIELSEEIEKEMTVLANRTIEAALFSIGPPIFYGPGVGEKFANRKYEPFDLIACVDPTQVKQLQISPNLEPFAQLWLMFQSIYEQLTGITNLAMGRGMDQPNAPRTLGGQRLVMGAGDVRLALDMRMLAEDLRRFLDWVWSLWTMFGSEETFFRVAEGDMTKGIFEHTEMTGDWAPLGQREREGHYDFTMEFADDMQIREGKKQEMIGLAQVLLSIPMVQQDPVAQYRIGQMVCEVFGRDFSEMASQPPPADMPKTPEQEMTMALEGQEIHVHPLDNDASHVADHESRITKMMNAPPEEQDHDALLAMAGHIQEHEDAIIQKRQAQVLVDSLQGMMAAAQSGVQGAMGATPGQGQNPLQAMLGGGGGMPGGAPSPPDQM